MKGIEEFGKHCGQLVQSPYKLPVPVSLSFLLASQPRLVSFCLERDLISTKGSGIGSFPLGQLITMLFPPFNVS